MAIPSVLESRTFNNIEMIDQRDFMRFMGTKVPSRFKFWSKFKTWSIFNGDDTITESITYHCNKKDYSLVKEDNKFALHFISRQFIKDIFIKHYNYNIDDENKINNTIIENVTFNEVICIPKKSINQVESKYQQ